MKERMMKEEEICFFYLINDETENSFAVEINSSILSLFTVTHFFSFINTGLAWMTYIAYTTKTETHSRYERV